MPLPKPFNWSRYSVSQKISLDYLLVSLFSLATVIFALTTLNRQTEISRHLVHVDFLALILENPPMTEHYGQRTEEFKDLWKSLPSLPLGRKIIPFENQVRHFQENSEEMLNLLRKKQWEEAGKFSKRETSEPLNDNLELFQALQKSFKKRLMTLCGTSPSMVCMPTKQPWYYFLGLLLASLVAVGLLLYQFNRPLHLLTSPTHQITRENHDIPESLDNHDEFGKLALEFSDMAQKKKMEQRRLGSSLLTHPPGDLTVEKKLQRRIEDKLSFANLYIDLDNFKPFNDRYGY